MKRTRLAAIAMAVFTLLSLCGCSSQDDNASTTPATDVVENDTKNVAENNSSDANVEVVENAPENAPQNNTEEVTANVPDTTKAVEEQKPATSSPLFTVNVKWANSIGGEDVLYTYAEMDQDVFNPEKEKTYNNNNTLVYTRTEGYSDPDKKIKNIDYLIYSLDSDLEILVEPTTPDNPQDMHTVLVEISNNMTGEKYSYNFDDVGRRGGTGIWYASVFTIKDGTFQPVN